MIQLLQIFWISCTALVFLIRQQSVYGFCTQPISGALRRIHDVPPNRSPHKKEAHTTEAFTFCKYVHVCCHNFSGFRYLYDAKLGFRIKTATAKRQTLNSTRNVYYQGRT